MCDHREAQIEPHEESHGLQDADPVQQLPGAGPIPTDMEDGQAQAGSIIILQVPELSTILTQRGNFLINESA